MIFLLVYVNDILFTGDNSIFLQHLITVWVLSLPFLTLAYFTIFYYWGFFHYKWYIAKFLKKAIMFECKPVATPIVLGSSLSKSISFPYLDPNLI